MNKIFTTITAILFFGFYVAGADPAESFSALFNGNDFTGWHGNNPHITRHADDRESSLTEQQTAFLTHWRVENGAMVSEGQGPHAATDRKFGDIELRLEYKVTKNTEAGIYLRGAPQIALFGDRRMGSGGLKQNPEGSPGREPLVRADRRAGQWNQLRVILLGSRTWVWLNDQLVVDGALFHNAWMQAETNLKGGQHPLPVTGPIHLQTHSGETHWRNIEIREIAIEEANRRLLEREKEGLVSMFNGEDLTGWQGRKDQYDISDSAIHSRGNAHIWTEKRYSDFIWRMEFRVAPGANNGLAIRYPGQRDPAYSGMCELQVLDDTAPKYANLDARQYHGSIYGMVAPLRGYLRPVNEWNYQEVRVVGSVITVELNGNIIVDADQAALTEAWRRPPNKVPPSGYLGLCGHGRGASFRNLMINDLAQ
jgi:hypothetical protein